MSMENVSNGAEGAEQEVEYDFQNQEFLDDMVKNFNEGESELELNPTLDYVLTSINNFKNIEDEYREEYANVFLAEALKLTSMLEDKNDLIAALREFGGTGYDAMADLLEDPYNENALKSVEDLIATTKERGVPNSPWMDLLNKVYSMTEQAYEE